MAAASVSPTPAKRQRDDGDELFDPNDRLEPFLSPFKSDEDALDLRRLGLEGWKMRATNILPVILEDEGLAQAESVVSERMEARLRDCKKILAVALVQFSELAFRVSTCASSISRNAEVLDGDAICGAADSFAELAANLGESTHGKGSLLRDELNSEEPLVRGRETIRWSVFREARLSKAQDEYVDACLSDGEDDCNFLFEAADGEEGDWTGSDEVASWPQDEQEAEQTIESEAIV